MSENKQIDSLSRANMEGESMADIDFNAYIPSIPDYPESGVIFRDITPLFANGPVLKAAIDSIADHFRGCGVTKVVGPEARGFLVGAPVAIALGAGFVPARKPGKLPRKTISETYALEYGTDTIEIHEDALVPGDKVLFIDDLIATGGTISAAAKLARKAGADIVGFGCILELCFLNPRDALAKLGDYEVFSLVQSR